MEEVKEEEEDERERRSKVFFMYHDPFLTNNFEPCVCVDSYQLLSLGTIGFDLRRFICYIR